MGQVLRESVFVLVFLLDANKVPCDRKCQKPDLSCFSF